MVNLVIVERDRERRGRTTMNSLTDKVVIVTGALGGIGQATARLLAEAGATLVLTDVVESGGPELAAEVASRGGDSSFIVADLANEEAVRRLVAHTVERFGRLDGAFNNAAIGQPVMPLVDFESEIFERILRVNVLGVFHCLKHQLPAMGEGGSIVNTSSALGVTAGLNAAAYTASKHAVCGLGRAAAIESAPRGIRVNTILPGATETRMQSDGYGSDASARAQVGNLLGRMARPEEIGNLARWLLSDESSFVTGGLLPVDGGRTAGRAI